MEATSKQGLHPLLTAAAVSVTVFSAVGIGALTGLLPTSMGSSKQAEPTQLTAPQGPVSAAPAPMAPVAEAKDMPPASATATPAPVAKPKPKKVVVARAPAAQPSGPVSYRDFPETAPSQAVAQATPAQAPKPVPAGILGVVESVREVSTPAKESNGVGPIAGGIAGAVIGNQFGNGMGRNVATVLGAAAGAFGGKEIEKQVRATKHWEVHVRLDDGTSRTITSEAQPFWHGGERVRFHDGRLTPA